VNSYNGFTLVFRDVTLSRRLLSSLPFQTNVVPLQLREPRRQRQKVTARKTWIVGNTAVIRSKPATSFATPTVKEISTHISSFSIHFWVRFLTTSTSSCFSDDGQSNRNTVTYTLRALHSKDRHQLYWFEAQNMESGITATDTFTLGTRRRWEVRFISHPAPLGTRPHTHCTGGWVDPNCSRTVVRRKENSFPPLGIELRFLACTARLVNTLTTLIRFTALNWYTNYQKQNRRNEEFLTLIQILIPFPLPSHHYNEL
jgi:hypothetical protein